MKIVITLIVVLSLFSSCRKNAKENDLKSQTKKEVKVTETVDSSNFSKDETINFFTSVEIEFEDKENTFFCDIKLNDSIDTVKIKLKENSKEFLIGEHPKGLIQIFSKTENRDEEKYILYFYKNKLTQINRWNVSLDEILGYNIFDKKFDFMKLRKFEQIEFKQNNFLYTFIKDGKDFTVSIVDLTYQEEISKLYD